MPTFLRLIPYFHWLFAFLRPNMNIYSKISFISILVLICEITIVRSDCIWFGECDVEGDKHRNCPYSGPPKNLTDLSTIQKLSALCPDLAKPTDRVVEICCDKKQIETLQKSMGLPQQILQRCPSCIRNFKQLWCQSTCSPKQSTFMSVVSTAFSDRTKKTYIDHAAYALNYSFFGDLLGSCKRVINPSTNKPALDMMCGGKTGDQCTPETFAKFLGNNEFSPMILDMDLTNKSSIVVGNKTLYPLNTRTIPCSSMTPELDLACSCQDCSQACPPIVPYPDSSEGKCHVGNIECMVFVSSLAFVGLCFLIIVMAVLHYVISQSTQENEDMPATPIERQGSQDDPHAQYYKTSSGANLVNDSEVTICERMGAWLEANMESVCYKWGRLCTRHPALVFMFGLSVSILCSLGIYHLNITTDPVALWSSPSSQGRMEKEYYDQNFGPFYRTAQIIIVPNNQTTFKPSDEKDVIFGPAFRKELLHQILKLQTSIESLVGEYNGRNVTLKSICVRPLYPDSEECLVQSPLGWFQNSHENLDKVVEDDDFNTFTYADHLIACIESATLTNDTKLNMSCLAPYGGPILPYVAMGNFSKNNLTTPNAVIITYLIKNNVETEKNGPAEAWEKSFISFMKSYQSRNFTFAFTSERSIQDEITRESQSDVATILISYVVMFLYIAFSLGQYNAYKGQLLYFLVQSKIVLGIVGVLIVMLSVTASVGFFAAMGIPATLIVIEVVPFLVLAVGVDNIFILVQAYQRDKPPKNEHVEDRIGRICGEVIPTMLLSSLSECFCFLLGALSTMPAVRTFSLYAGMAIFFDFFLQVTCFVALFTVDVKRQEDNRLEICCCVRLAPSEKCTSPTAGGQQQQAVVASETHSEGMLFALVRDYYAPFLLQNWVRYVVLVIFLMWMSTSLFFMGKIDVGLDQALSMPEDSYVLRYFHYMTSYLSVGPPVYFVVRGKLDYSKRENQNLICGSSGCKYDSLVGQIYTASLWYNRSYIAQPAQSWLDDYFDWLRPVGNPPCCRVYSVDNSTFCPSTAVNGTCKSCNVPYISGRPSSGQFYQHLPAFLEDNPGFKCAKGGHAAYSSSLKFGRDKREIVGTNFMTYHTVLKTSQEYTDALRNARAIAENITRTIGQRDVEVFPYSIFYVFYEQYLTVVRDAIVQIIFSLVAIFIVSTILLGLDPWSAAMIVATIVLILINLMGLMYLWSISFNAVSLVNAVMSIGISVEFCAHLVRSFKNTAGRNRIERAKQSLSTMGSSVLSGITLTKFGGIVVLAFSHSQIFQVFYFRMYMGIVFIGATHGLIFLPVLLSFFGPSLSKHKFSNGFKTTNAKHPFMRERPRSLTSAASLVPENSDANAQQGNIV